MTQKTREQAKSLARILASQTLTEVTPDQAENLIPMVLSMCRLQLLRQGWVVIGNDEQVLQTALDLNEGREIGDNIQFLRLGPFKLAIYEECQGGRDDRQDEPG